MHSYTDMIRKSLITGPLTPVALSKLMARKSAAPQVRCTRDDSAPIAADATFALSASIGAQMMNLRIDVAQLVSSYIDKN